MIIASRSVLDIVPDFAQPPRKTAKRAAMVNDLGQAARMAGYRGEDAIHLLSHSYMLPTKALIESFSEFFDERAGSWGGFWLPSWHAELNPTASILTGDNELAITQVEYNATYLTGTNTTRLGNYLWLAKYDGSIHYSRVTGCADGTPEVLTLEDAPAVDFTLGEYIVGFLYLVRFMSDSLSLEFNGPNQATANVSFIECPETDVSADVT